MQPREIELEISQCEEILDDENISSRQQILLKCYLLERERDKYSGFESLNNSNECEWNRLNSNWQ